MAGVPRHNICIHMHDPCKPPWKLIVEDFEFIDQQVSRQENR